MKTEKVRELAKELNVSDGQTLMLLGLCYNCEHTLRVVVGYYKRNVLSVPSTVEEFDSFWVKSIIQRVSDNL